MDPRGNRPNQPCLDSRQRRLRDSGAVARRRRACPRGVPRGDTGARQADLRRAARRGAERREPDHAGEDRARPPALLRAAHLDQPQALVQLVPRPRDLRRRQRADVGRTRRPARRAQFADRLQRGAALRAVLGRPRAERRGAGQGPRAEPGRDGHAEPRRRGAAAGRDPGLPAALRGGVPGREGSRSTTRTSRRRWAPSSAGS